MRTGSDPYKGLTGRPLASKHVSAMLHTLVHAGTKNPYALHKLLEEMDHWLGAVDHLKAGTEGYHASRIKDALNNVLINKQGREKPLGEVDLFEVVHILRKTSDDLGLDVKFDVVKLLPPEVIASEINGDTETKPVVPGKTQANMPNSGDTRPVSAPKNLASRESEPGDSTAPIATNGKPKGILNLSDVGIEDLQRIITSLEALSELFSPHIMDFDKDIDLADRQQQRVDNIRSTIATLTRSWTISTHRNEGKMVLDAVGEKVTFDNSDRSPEKVERMLRESQTEINRWLDDVTSTWLKREWVGPYNEENKLTRKRVCAYVQEQLAVSLVAKAGDTIDNVGAAIGAAWNPIYLSRAVARKLWNETKDPIDAELVHALERQKGDGTDPKMALSAIIERAVTLAKSQLNLGTGKDSSQSKTGTNAIN